jgi:hypothetical protein
MKLDELYDALRWHDWYYQMADDPRAYRAGLAAQRHLRGLAETAGEAGRLLFDAFEAHHSTTEDPPPLPDRPGAE